MKDTIACNGSEETIITLYENLFDRLIDFYEHLSDGSINHLVKSTISFLRISKKILGVRSGQDEAELWLISMLRAMYKLNRSSFKQDDIEDLKTIAALEEGRKLIQPVNQPLTTGINIIVKDEIEQVTEWSGGNKKRRLHEAKLLWGDHIQRVEKIINVFNALDITAPPERVASSFITIIENRKIQSYRVSYELFRKDHNLPQAELRFSNQKKQRKTHCWNCKKYLETGLFLECSSCGWLVCRCGACGCGRDENSESKHKVESDPQFKENGM